MTAQGHSCPGLFHRVFLCLVILSLAISGALGIQLCHHTSQVRWDCSLTLRKAHGRGPLLRGQVPSKGTMKYYQYNSQETTWT